MSGITIGVASETASGEKRVALTPETCKKLVARGARVRIERGAGRAASFTDDAYLQAGAELADDAGAATGEADVVLCVQAPDPAR
ncbi:NAD(P)(+) transhydrogenase (Re/Si-specific) subunit alpha, partial [Lysobacter gummosus]